MPPPGSIFISYRRSDSIGDTGRIYDYLERHFGRNRVFKDVDSIPLGVNFREYLDQEVGRCQVLVAVIGPTWLTVTGEDGQRRLDSPTDFVRIEIESALRRKIPVIPLLVNGASMPSAAKLPGELQALPDWQTVIIRHDPDFRRDVNKLIQGIESLMGQTQSHQATPSRSASRARSPESPQRSRSTTRKAIPWLRLAAILWLYALQGYLITAPLGGAVVWAGGGAVAVAWAAAWAAAVAWVGAGAGAAAVTVAWAGGVIWARAADSQPVLAALIQAGAVAVVAAAAGIKLKAYFRAIQMFWILWGAAIVGLGVGALLARLH